jgi:hypothetical protein
MSGFQKLRTKPFPKRKRSLPQLKRRSGFLRRYARWLVIPGALLAAASFFAEDVYQDHINSTIEDAERQIEEAASPDESPTSKSEEKTAHESCKFSDTKELSLHFSDHIQDMWMESLACLDEVTQMGQKLKDLNQGTDELRAHIIVSAEQAKRFDQSEAGSKMIMDGAISAAERCKATIDSLAERCRVIALINLL